MDTTRLCKKVIEETCLFILTKPLQLHDDPPKQTFLYESLKTFVNQSTIFLLKKLSQDKELHKKFYLNLNMSDEERESFIEDEYYEHDFFPKALYEIFPLLTVMHTDTLSELSTLISPLIEDIVKKL